MTGCGTRNLYSFGCKVRFFHSPLIQNWDLEYFSQFSDLATNWTSMVRFLAGGSKLSLLGNMQTGPGHHPASLYWALEKGGGHFNWN